MFSIIRYIIGLIFLVCALIIIKKKAIHKTALYIVFVGLWVVLMTALALFPFENAFITFDSPEAAYDYWNFGQSDVALVVEGERCDLVVERKDDVTTTHALVPKTANGWKIVDNRNFKKILCKLTDDGISVDVYQYKNTNDYFIIVLDTNGGETNILDDYNNKFYSLKSKNEYLGKIFVTYYAHVSQFNAQYSITVNANKIVVGSGQSGDGSVIESSDC